MEENMFPISMQKNLSNEVLKNELQDVRALIVNYIMHSKMMKVLELGAGVGRLSGLLADLFQEVLATDSRDDYVAKNKENNQLPNIVHSVINATQLHSDFPTDSLDVVFSNWLLMYMSNDEVQSFAQDTLRLLKPGGYVIFRESHLYPNNAAVADTAIYRSLDEYHKCFLDAKYTTQSENQEYVFEFILGQSSPTSVKYRNYMADIYWIWQKKKAGETPVRDLQTWSDECCEEEGTASDNHSSGGSSVSYPEEGFGTPGGLPLLKQILTKLNIKPGNTVVEVGSGSGGAMKYISQELKAYVTGVECMVNDVEKSIKMFNDLGTHREDVVIGDVKCVHLPANYYDFVCAREFIQCAPDKLDYCAQFMKWLKPGGQVLIAGFFIGNNCEEAHTFVNGFGWPPLLSASAFAKLLTDTGFTDIVVEDFSGQYMKIVEDHLAAYEGLTESDRKMWEGFAKTFKEQFDKKFMTWSLITAKKPSIATS